MTSNGKRKKLRRRVYGGDGDGERKTTPPVAINSGDATSTNNSASAASPIIHVVEFNPASQLLPIKLQGNLNFSTWKAQLVMLLNGHTLMGHLDRSKLSPPMTVTRDNLTIPDPRYHIWFSQDQLIQQAVMASVDPTIAPTVGTTPSSKTAWEFLHKASKSVTEYLQEVRIFPDTVKVVGSPVQDDKLIVKFQSGLGPEYREISASVRARDSFLSFEELFHKLTDHELFLKHQDLEKSSSNIIAAVEQRTNMPAQSKGQSSL
ncbi:uncharacterized protein [Solanum tuberosum]|uniref:uncharacterized protein n=1 Tax=Solanum tuberosum TaxID=4113 RepID=UPI00073A1713|nr:PREDICTED: uncharacterized protein LOC107062067 [Solanum tuberosum]